MSTPPFYQQRNPDLHQLVFDAEDPLLPELLRTYRLMSERAGASDDELTRCDAVLGYVTTRQRLVRS